MVTQNDEIKLEITEAERLLEEFRQKLTVSLRYENERLRESADKDSKLLLARTYQDSSNITLKAQEEARQIIQHAKEKAGQEAAVLISKAQQKAEQVISATEEAARKEAKEKTKKEIEYLLRTAKEEAAKQNAKSVQTAREEANSIIASGKKEAAAASRQMLDEAEKQAERLIQSATEMKKKAADELANIRKKTADAVQEVLSSTRKTAIENAEKEAAEIISQVRLKAQKEREALISSATADAKREAEAESNRILQKSRQEAEEIIAEAKRKINSQIEESSRLMQEIQQKMQQVIGKAMSQTTHPVQTPSPEVKLPGVRAESQPATHTEKKEPQISSNSNNPGSQFLETENQIYEGRLKIDIAPPTESEQILSLEKYLLRVTDLRVIGRGGSEDGSAWIEIELVKPLPLVEILKQIPFVKDVVGAKSYIIIAMKTKQLV